MADNTHRFGNKTNYSKHYITIILTLVAALLIWQGFSRYTTHKRNQQLLVINSVNGASSEISATISRLQRAVSVFSNEHLPIIQHLASHPDDDTSFEELKKHAASRFPDYFAITIANDKGIPLLGNFDLLINELCQRDMKDFIANGYHYNVFIHPHPDAYHIDIMTPWAYPGEKPKRGIFFISIRPVSLSRILKNAQLLNHKLMLIKNDISGLIEISSSGTRIDMPELNGNFFLSEEQIKNIRFSIPVKESRWNLVDIPGKAISNYITNSILAQSLSVFTLVLIISWVFFKMIKREEGIRLNSEINLERANDELRQTLSFSGVGIWKCNIQTNEITWSDNIKNLFHEKNPDTLTEYLSYVDKEHKNSLYLLFCMCIESTDSHHLEYKTSTSNDGGGSWHEITGKLHHDKTTYCKEIIGLIRDISDRKLSENEKIHFERHQKETLVREVHHRIKNSLQGIIGLLQQHIDKGSKNASILRHAISQLHSVSMVHDMQSNNQEQVLCLINLIYTICDSSFQSMGIRKNLSHLKSLPNTFHINNRHGMAISLIINEIIFNAIKHTAPEATDTIKINLTQHDETAIFEVTNNGYPLPENFNFLQQQGIGTGLTLIKSLTPKNGVEFSIEQSKESIISRLVLSKPTLVKINEPTSTLQ